MTAAGFEESSHFRALEKTVQNIALQLNNVEQENGMIRKENMALRVTKIIKSKKIFLIL